MAEVAEPNVPAGTTDAGIAQAEPDRKHERIGYQDREQEEGGRDERVGNMPVTCQET